MPQSKSDSSYGSVMKLRDDLLANYSHTLRPLKNQSEAIDVELSLLVDGVTEVNDISQTVTLNFVLKVNWTDEFLQWDKDEYGIEFINLPNSAKWTPRLMVLNSIHKRAIFSDDQHPYMISYNGQINWTPASVFTFYCQLDMTYFPFDSQTCTIYIMAIDYSMQQLNIYFEEGPRFTSKQENGEWDVIDLELQETAQKDLTERPEHKVLLKLKRRSAFILLNVYLPVIVLSFLNLAVFVVPAESGEKLSYVLTVLLSLAVFISVVSGMLPTTSTNIPIITIYLSLQLLISTVSVLLTVYVIRIHHRSADKPIPSHLQFLTRIMKKKANNKVDLGSSDDRIKNWNIVALSVDKLCLYIFTTIVLSSCCALLFIIAKDEY
ncbi:hypothetical protein LOTGIDRAFT_160549 [Lottia gigantea]|uniref:Neurotransmitter-gated ion-channel ligand-binding domain-containing protein n=1 Tax=Lottia gigantea TaxID=225164 RepID=V4AL10_LOTGI|nr:hypothetical protein LOTGIDRAFT_160549 [Lottia gigantea]ESO95410.1 hypothetical protein LOTGIDRAFT_160549 [Lottia gigantea]